MKKIIIYILLLFIINSQAATLNGTNNPPSGIGVTGDFYINTSTWEIFGPKTNNQWGNPIYLRGDNATIIDTNKIVLYSDKNNNEIFLGTNKLKITSGNFLLNSYTLPISSTNISFIGRSVLAEGVDYTNQYKFPILFNSFIVFDKTRITNTNFNNDFGRQTYGRELVNRTANWGFFSNTVCINSSMITLPGWRETYWWYVTTATNAPNYCIPLVFSAGSFLLYPNDKIVFSNALEDIHVQYKLYGIK